MESPFFCFAVPYFQEKPYRLGSGFEIKMNRLRALLMPFFHLLYQLLGPLLITQNLLLLNGGLERGYLCG